MRAKDEYSQVECARPVCHRKLTNFQVWSGVKCCSASCGQRLRWGEKESDTLSPRDPWEKKAPAMESDLDEIRAIRRDREIRELMAAETRRTGVPQKVAHRRRFGQTLMIRTARAVRAHGMEG